MAIVSKKNVVVRIASPAKKKANGGKRERVRTNGEERCGGIARRESFKRTIRV